MSLVFAHRGTLYVVLDEENIERIVKNDPYDFSMATLPPNAPPVSLDLSLSIVVAYASKSEQATIQSMSNADAVVRYLRRGYEEHASDFERAALLAKLKAH